MTEGSLKLNETARTSRSYTEMISTLPWHQSVTAFCQWTILRGSYDALRSSVCSTAILILRWIVPDGPLKCQAADGLKPIGKRRLAALRPGVRAADILQVPVVTPCSVGLQAGYGAGLKA